MRMQLKNLFLLEDNSAVLKALTLFSCIVLLLICFFTYRPIPSSSRQSVMPRPVSSQVPLSMIRLAAEPRALNISGEPTFPPVLAVTPIPVPTPAGGGILRKIAFTSNRADGRHYQIYMMDANGKKAERLLESDFFDRDPHFSYDGQRIAFASNRSGTYQIYVLDMDTRAVRRLTTGPQDKSNPFWSPDGSQLLYTFNTKGSFELGLMNADGSQARQITNKSFGDSHGYGFAPDGCRISFESTMNNRNEVFIMDLERMKSRVLIETDELSYRGDPVFSPAGNKIVFCSNTLDRKTRQLYIYDLDWKKYYRITDDALDKDDPIFSPDGTRIAYVARWQNAWNIFVADADGKYARNLTCSYYDNVVPSWR